MPDRYDIRDIGNLDHGIDGSDQYLLVRDLERDLDQQIDRRHVFETIMPRYYRPCPRPGAYYCKSLRVIPDPVLKNQCIAIIEHRYDV